MRKITIIGHMSLDGVIQGSQRTKGNPPRELALVSTKAVSSGVIVITYRPNRPLRTGTFGEAA